MKQQLFLLALLGALVINLVACDEHINPQPVPQYDTAFVYTYDTTISPVERIDTIGMDTLVQDTLIPLDNDYVVCSYIAYYGTKWPLPQYLTHAIYSCAELYVVDNVYQKIGLHLTSGKDQKRFIKFTQLKEKNPDLKLMVSVAHVCDLPDNSQGGSFSALSKDSMMRRQFALDCIAMCEEYNLDGIDINWELPGVSESGAAADVTCDSQNFTKLVRDMRAVFDEKGHPEYLITYAGHNRDMEKVDGGYQFMDLSKIGPYISWANVMCYGLDQAPLPQNALFCTAAYHDINSVYQSYKKAGFSMSQFVLGCPFYTRPPKEDTSIKGEWYYASIIELVKYQSDKYRFNYNHRHDWGVPYVEKKVNGTWKMYGSIEDSTSLYRKAQYVRDRGMHGIMWWENEGDDNKHTLQKAAWNALKSEIRHDTTFLPITDTIPAMDTLIITRCDTIITKRDNKKK